jgi:hypothetical protein
MDPAARAENGRLLREELQRIALNEPHSAEPLTQAEPGSTSN